MLLHFYKYQATGNDFIIIDCNEHFIDFNNEKLIQQLCNRHFGIGADGLILFCKHNTYDFEMKYFNSDGKLATMCGNGGRSIVKFAYDKNYIHETCVFLASDGIHKATLTNNNTILLNMQDVQEIKQHCDGFEINTGSPHFVIPIKENIDDINVNNIGKEIRFQNRFKPYGINVNFVHRKDDHIYLRTYERGVENETLSCGTGAVASAIWSCLSKPMGKYSIPIKTMGGVLTVHFDKQDNLYTNIWLEGEAKFVFEGKINLQDVIF
ncbi:MAG: diaminopimelate epimerase [Bacteroidales bacterium]|nr:diaminopimelate epimerase [Bacteroidales bacterium]